MTKADPGAMAGLEQQANAARTQDVVDLSPKAKWALIKKIRKKIHKLVNMPKYIEIIKLAFTKHSSGLLALTKLLQFQQKI